MIGLLNITIYGYIFIIGICIGSVLNGVIYGLPIHSCLIWGGKCRNCKVKISPRDFVIDLISGLMAVFLYWLYGWSYMTVCFFLLFSVLLCVTMIDWDTRTIPNELIIFLALLAVPITILQVDISLLNRVIGFFVISFPMFLLCLVVDSAFGGGDIKLMAVCGFILGYHKIIFAMFLGCVLGGIYGVYLLSFKKVGKRSQMCFGPFLSIAIMVSAIFI